MTLSANKLFSIFRPTSVSVSLPNGQKSQSVALYVRARCRIVRVRRHVCTFSIGRLSGILSQVLLICLVFSGVHNLHYLQTYYAKLGPPPEEGTMPCGPIYLLPTSCTSPFFHQLYNLLITQSIRRPLCLCHANNAFCFECFRARFLRDRVPQNRRRCPFFALWAHIVFCSTSGLVSVMLTKSGRYKYPFPLYTHQPTHSFTRHSHFMIAFQSGSSQRSRLPLAFSEK